MKLIDKYRYLKSKYGDYIVLLKSGNFYVTFESDALILNKIFNYQVVNGKVGFPLNSIPKVESGLQNSLVNYVIENGNDKDITEYTTKQNEYISYFGEAKKRELKDNLNYLLIEKIKTLIANSQENYDKIRKFVDEL